MRVWPFHFQTDSQFHYAVVVAVLISFICSRYFTSAMLRMRNSRSRLHADPKASAWVSLMLLFCFFLAFQFSKLKFSFSTICNESGEEKKPKKLVYIFKIEQHLHVDRRKKFFSWIYICKCLLELILFSFFVLFLKAINYLIYPKVIRFKFHIN